MGYDVLFLFVAYFVNSCVFKEIKWKIINAFF